MLLKGKTWLIGIVLGLGISPGVGAASGAQTGGTMGQRLGLVDLEQVALRRDPLIQKYQSEARAMEAEGIAARQNPDPKLKIGLMNVPVDSFDMAQEPMTQQVIGVQQMFMPGRRREGMGRRMEAMAGARRAAGDHQGLLVQKDVRQTWLKVYKLYHAAGIIRNTRETFRQILDITRLQYRAGRGNQQDVIRAELELNLLEDKLIEIDTSRLMALAALSRRVGSGAREENLDLDSLRLPAISARGQIAAGLASHPMARMKEQMVISAQEGMEVAHGRYDIGWMLDLSYGLRQPAPNGMDRADFVSAMVMVDLPFFSRNRQDKWLAASEAELGAARSDVEDTRYMLQARLDAQYDRLEKLQQRLSYYRDTVLPQSGQNAEAALKAYQSRAGEFTPLIRARLMELKNKLQALDIVVEHAQAQTELLYLAGG